MNASQKAQRAKDLYNQENEENLKEYFELLRFKSLSADPSFKKDLHACADWVENYLKKCSLHIERWEKKGCAPVLFAYTDYDPQKETLLLYNHYDVQPVDPIELWTTDPFEPNIRHGEVFARGASDNKGQLFYTLRALKIFLKHNTPKFNIKYVIEGEEESGSSALSALLKEKADRLQAHHILIIDSGIPAIDRPTITLGARGLVAMNLTMSESNCDLHSGTYGGMVYNPNRALVELLAGTHDKNNHVTIPHFYDDVLTISDEEKKLYDLSYDPEHLKKTIGIEPCGFEKGFTPPEAAALRPTLEINGIAGGYAGIGFKTVIPAKAFAKVSCRLVPNQNPEKIGKLVKEYFLANTPKGLHLEVEILSGMGEGLRTKPDSKIAKIAMQAYEDVFSKPCGKIVLGGSVPIAASLQKVANADLILIGVDLPDDKIHSPDEHFGLDRLELGFLTMIRIFELLNR